MEKALKGKNLTHKNNATTQLKMTDEMGNKGRLIMRLRKLLNDGIVTEEALAEFMAKSKKRYILT